MGMDTSERLNNIYSENTAIEKQVDNCTVYRMKDSMGEAVMTTFQVFPGIELTYNDVHTAECVIEKTVQGNILEISHCHQGRIECENKDEFFYLTPGDMSVSKKDDVRHKSYFPLGNYSGITITIDVEQAPECLSCFLDDVNVRPSALIQKFCSSSRCFVARSDTSIEHIFSELYSVPDSIKKGYLKVKILELLLFLSGMDMKKDVFDDRRIPKNQAVLAKNVYEYLTRHMESRITLEQLSNIFHVSGTQIKNSFKGVYGVSVYSYIRAQKMQSAALLLQQTDMTVLEVAGHFGYDNGSKFAKAFKDTLGMTPNEYRNSKLFFAN